jgi:hypothetical protein
MLPDYLQLLDNCGVKSVTTMRLGVFPIGNTTVTWTVTDNAEIQLRTKSTVVDTINPTITVPLL